MTFLFGNQRHRLSHLSHSLSDDFWVPVTIGTTSALTLASGMHDQKLSVKGWTGGETDKGHHTYWVAWDALQSYQFKHILFNKGCQHSRDSPNWEQSKLMSSASCNEAIAMMSCAAINKSDPMNTAQLPYKFNFALVKPVFIEDIEAFLFDVEQCVQGCHSYWAW